MICIIWYIDLLQLNMAQIMESTSEPMKIQISEATQILLDEQMDIRRSSITVQSKRPKFITQLREEVRIFSYTWKK